MFCVPPLHCSVQSPNQLNHIELRKLSRPEDDITAPVTSWLETCTAMIEIEYFGLIVLMNDNWLKHEILNIFRSPHRIRIDGFQSSLHLTLSRVICLLCTWVWAYIWSGILIPRIEVSGVPTFNHLWDETRAGWGWKLSPVFYSLLNYLRRRGFDVSENKFTKQMSTVHSAQLKFLQLKFLLFTINEMINKREESISEFKDGTSEVSCQVSLYSGDMWTVRPGWEAGEGRREGGREGRREEGVVMIIAVLPGMWWCAGGGGRLSDYQLMTDQGSGPGSCLTILTTQSTP